MAKAIRFYRRWAPHVGIVGIVTIVVTVLVLLGVVISVGLKVRQDSLLGQRCSVSCPAEYRYLADLNECHCREPDGSWKLRFLGPDGE